MVELVVEDIGVDGLHFTQQLSNLLAVSNDISVLRACVGHIVTEEVVIQVLVDEIFVLLTLHICQHIECYVVGIVIIGLEVIELDLRILQPPVGIVE